MCRYYSHAEMTDILCREKSVNQKVDITKNHFVIDILGYTAYLLFQILDQQCVNTALLKMLGAF